MADKLVIDPVFRMRHRFSRSTDPDGSEVLHSRPRSTREAA